MLRLGLRRVLCSQPREQLFGIDRVPTLNPLLYKPAKLLKFKRLNSSFKVPIPERFANCFTCAGVFSSLNVGAEIGDHLRWQGNANLLNRMHLRPPYLSIMVAKFPTKCNGQSPRGKRQANGKMGE